MSNPLIDRLQVLAEKAKHLSRETPPHIEEKQIKRICEMLGDDFPIKTLEEIIKIYKQRLSDIITKLMPEIMNELGIQSLTLESGEKLDIKKMLNSKVKDKEKTARWLKEIDMEEVIKTTLKFTKGEVDEVLLQALDGYSYERDDAVHYQTLSKIIRDRYVDGQGLPPADAIEVTPFDEVKIS